MYKLSLKLGYKDENYITYILKSESEYVVIVHVGNNENCAVTVEMLKSLNRVVATSLGT